jgi:nitrite reductase/ring-hydroxylating ferredoxin subunit
MILGGADPDEDSMREQTHHSVSPTDRLGRRQLLRGSLAFLGGLPLCCTTPVISPAAVKIGSDALLIDLRLAPELNQTGSAAAIVDLERKLNLIVARPARKQFVALDRSCTHGGAQCTYNHARRTLQCTSLNHAEYDLKGTLLHGRTHGNLRAYEARLTGAILEIRLAGY